jgi:hypothetical protein
MVCCESELASYPVYNHVVRQLAKFINGIENQSARNEILDTLYDEIRNGNPLRASRAIFARGSILAAVMINC